MHQEDILQDSVQLFNDALMIFEIYLNDNDKADFAWHCPNCMPHRYLFLLYILKRRQVT
jgi:hypothetical protein